jgi:hypothetical protein
MSDKYILTDDRRAVPIDDLIAWAQWFEVANRQVAVDRIGDTTVSTVFLALDHRFGEGPPLIFETMIFNGPLDGEQGRYSTWDEAIAGHAAAAGKVREAMN